MFMSRYVFVILVCFIYSGFSEVVHSNSNRKSIRGGDTTRRETSNIRKNNSIFSRKNSSTSDSSNSNKRTGESSIKDEDDGKDDQTVHPNASFSDRRPTSLPLEYPIPGYIDEHRIPSLSIGGILAAIKPYMNAENVFTAAQVGICYWLVTSIWKEMKDTWNEVVEEAEEKSKGTSSSIEEHDLPYLSAESVDLLLLERQFDHYKNKIEALSKSEPLTNSTNNNYKSYEDTKNNTAKNNFDQIKNKKPIELFIKTPSGRKRSASFIQRIERDASCARELTKRLNSAGLPFIEEQVDTNSFQSDIYNISKMPSSNDYTSSPTVDSVLKSISKTEGNILSSTLLSPYDINPRFFQSNKESEDNDDADFTKNEVFTAWDEIGGLSEVKEGLLDVMYPLLQQQYGVDDNYGGLLSPNSGGGILFYGPPGCGKTMLASALAQSVGARFLCVRPSTLFRKFVGETNLNVRALFSLARKIQPCVIFVDELDGLFRERGSANDEHDVNRDLKTEFMQLWDGITTTSPFSNDGKDQDKSSGSQNQVIVIGATNRPFDVDAAFLRRMPRSFFVGLPNFSSRCEILRCILRKVPLDSDFDVELIARETEGYSGSDLKELLRTAALIPLRECRLSLTQQLQQRKKQQSPQKLDDIQVPPLRPLRTNDVLIAKESVQPTQWSNHYRNALVEYAQRQRNGSNMGDQFNYGMNTRDSASDDMYSHVNQPNEFGFINDDHRNEQIDSDILSDEEDQTTTTDYNDEDYF